MKLAVVAAALAVSACRAKDKAPPSPPPPPAPGDASTAEACKRAAQDQIMRSDRDISNALAAQKLVLFAPQFLPTPFDEAPRGADPAASKRHDEALAPFTGKHTGDTVTWKSGAGTTTGIFIEPAEAGWIVARRGSEIVLAKPARWRPITCIDRSAYSGGCTGTGPKPLVFSLPPGTVFGGTLELDAERVTLNVTGGPPAPCPP